jgi:hypothetical protein
MRAFLDADSSRDLVYDVGIFSVRCPHVVGKTELHRDFDRGLSATTAGAGGSRGGAHIFDFEKRVKPL